MSVSDRRVDRERIETWGRTLLDELASVERELWLVVAVTLVADVWLTHLGLQYGLREANPVMRWLIETFGIAALAATKLGILAVSGAVRETLPRRQAPFVPLGLALPWTAAVLVNGTLLLGR